MPFNVIQKISKIFMFRNQENYYVHLMSEEINMMISL